MKKFRYESFEEFENTAKMIGLENAYAERHRQTGRTTQILVDALNDYLKCDPNDNIIVVFHAHSQHIENMMIEKFKDMIKATINKDPVCWVSSHYNRAQKINYGFVCSGSILHVTDHFQG